MDTLQYRGKTEEDRREAAIYYDRIRGMIERMQRTGFPLTSGDIEALNFCIDVLIVSPPPQGTPTAQSQEQPESESPMVERPGRRIRQV